MIVPRHIVTWGERLKWKRHSNNPNLDGESRCMYHLMVIGVCKRFNLDSAAFHFEKNLGGDCFFCYGAKTCSYFASEE